MNEWKGGKQARGSASALADTRGSSDATGRHSDIEALYQKHAKDLTAALRSRFGNGPPDPEDVAQQAFQKLLEREDRSDIRNLKAFLWRTARNAFLSGFYREDVRGRYDFEIELLFFPERGVNSSPERVLSIEEELQAVNEALRLMPERRRHAFILHKVEGLSVAEVAKRLNVSLTPVRKHITRAAHDIEIHVAEIQRRGRK